LLGFFVFVLDAGNTGLAVPSVKLGDCFLAQMSKVVCALGVQPATVRTVLIRLTSHIVAGLELTLANAVPVTR